MYRKYFNSKDKFCLPFFSKARQEAPSSLLTCSQEAKDLEGVNDLEKRLPSDFTGKVKGAQEAYSETCKKESALRVALCQWTWHLIQRLCLEMSASVPMKKDKTLFGLQKSGVQLSLKLFILSQQMPHFSSNECVPHKSMFL